MLLPQNKLLKQVWLENIFTPIHFLKKSKTGVLLKWLPATGPTVFYGWRFVVYNTEKFFIGGTGFTGQYGGPDDYGTLTAAGMTAGWDFKSLTISMLTGAYLQVVLVAETHKDRTIEEGGVLVSLGSV
ncbi:MAG: hypothetical protein CM1200mP28_02370 [Deltaproteobacteria bacterium]|nr:MAG: hypothetical protein CM1200mP28_02370 [Deltaproteobacteria bacterium]